GRDGNSVEESMNYQADQHRETFASGNELVVVSLLAEVKVGGNRVLEKMNDEITREDQQRRASPAKRQTFRNYFNSRRGQHESRAQSDEILEIRTVPVSLDDDGAAEDV